MTIQIGNRALLPGCGDFRTIRATRPWRTALKQCADAGYTGIELGPVGFMPEDPAILAEGARRARAGA